MFTVSNAPLDDDDKDMEMFYLMTALDARLCSVKKESCCSTSQLVTTLVSAFILFHEMRYNNGSVHTENLPLGFCISRIGSLKLCFLENYWC